MQAPVGKWGRYFASGNDFQVRSFTHTSRADGALARVLVVHG